MKNKELTPTQIEYLFTFMRRKYVRYYDVQIELVDHFASAIEERWKTEPNLSFEKAVEKVYSGFPITGFNNLMNEKTQVLQQKIKTHTWKEIKAYLTIPKVALTLLLIAGFNIFYNLIPNPFWVAFLIIEIIGLSSTFFLKFLIKPYQQKKTKFLVLEAIIFSQVGISFMGFIPFNFDSTDFSAWIGVLLSCFTVFSILASIGHYKVATSIFEEWKQQFPQFV